MDIKPLNKTTYQELSNTDGFAVIKFYADWCKPCKSLELIFYELSKEINIPFYNCNYEENKEIAFSADIKTLPTIILLEIKNGKFDWIGNSTVIKGFQEKDKIKNIIISKLNDQ